MQRRSGLASRGAALAGVGRRQEWAECCQNFLSVFFRSLHGATGDAVFECSAIAS
ncbi:MAG: hypothetical protein AAF376_03555 [Pseudomonadota bacterium]